MNPKIVKPNKKRIICWDWSECTKYIEAKYKITTSDYLNSHLQSTQFYLKMKFPKRDAEGKSRGDSQIFYAAYQRELESGKIEELPYQNFWHWVVENLEPKRGGFVYIDSDVLTLAHEPWQETILGHYLDEFGAGKDRHCKFHTDW